MKKIIINGYPKSGKDTFVNMVIHELRKKGYHGFCISSVDKIKAAAKLMGWDGIKDEKGRKFLSDLKTLSVINYDGPMKYMSDEIERLSKINNCVVLFFMIREMEEIKKFVNKYPETSVLLIRRNGLVQEYSNSSDKDVLSYENYNYVIDNDGDLKDLEEKAISFTKKLMK